MRTAGSPGSRAVLLAAAAAVMLIAAPVRADGAEDRPAKRGWFSLPARLVRGSIGLVEVDAAIYGSKPVIAQIQAHARNPLVKAMLLRVDSPGGDVGAVQEIVAELQKFRAGEGGKRRPIVASFAGVAASGGYYIAAPADLIYSNAGTLTGSIGVIIEFPIAEQLMKKVGIEYVVIKSGRFKDIGNFARAMSKEERAMIEQTVNDVYEQFLEAIMAGRKEKIRRACAADLGRPAAKVSDRETWEYLRDVADGRVMSGRQAFELGLVDELGGLEAAVSAAAKLAGISTDRPSLVHPPRRRQQASWMDLVTGWLNLPAPSGAAARPNRVALEYMLR